MPENNAEYREYYHPGRQRGPHEWEAQPFVESRTRGKLRLRGRRRCRSGTRCQLGRSGRRDQSEATPDCFHLLERREILRVRLTPLNPPRRLGLGQRIRVNAHQPLTRRLETIDIGGIEVLVTYVHDFVLAKASSGVHPSSRNLQ